MSEDEVEDMMRVNELVEETEEEGEDEDQARNSPVSPAERKPISVRLPFNPNRKPG
jgi:hypothetical protein